jgi:hypothetical protein
MTTRLPEKNENGEIRGLWITDIPLTEEAYMLVSTTCGDLPHARDIYAWIEWKDNWLCDDGWQENWFYSWHYPERLNNIKISYKEFVKHYTEGKTNDRS